MDGARSDPPNISKTEQAASGGPLGMGGFEQHAMTLFENGYAPIPIRPGQKVPAVTRWSDIPIDEQQIDRWVRSFPGHGVGLRTGPLVGVDIDILDDEVAWQVSDLAQRMLGQTLMRVGLWPKRLLLFRTNAPFPKIDVKPIEVLGAGQQFVAFGRHPDTGRAYRWPSGETPLDVALSELPSVTQEQCEAFVTEALALIPDHLRPRLSSVSRGKSGTSSGPVRDETGRVIDGRDDWLSRIAFHVVHDALDRNAELNPERLASMAWDRFADSTDLGRSRQNRRASWDWRDARKKVADKLRLHEEGRLPPRQKTDLEAEYVAPAATAGETRQALEARLEEYLEAVLAWHAGGCLDDPPRLAIQATTGLGKSAISRRLIADLRPRLQQIGAPDRVLVFVPSHVLAEEAAAGWRELGLAAAVHRGYERQHPDLHRPMCEDVEAVKAAMAAGLDPHTTICTGKGGLRCPFFTHCLKQQNRDEVAAADIVLAPYDALFSGFAVDASTIGLIVIDEAFWSRAWRGSSATSVEGLIVDVMGKLGTGLNRNMAASQMADRRAYRQRLQAALAANGPGPVTASRLVEAGLSARDCADAARLDRHLMVDPGLAPGLVGRAREQALRTARENERVRGVIDLWWAAAGLLGEEDAPQGRLRVEKLDQASGTHRVRVLSLSGINEAFMGKPILHLDATMRPPIVECLLPGAECVSFEAAPPHMAVHLVTGRFSKGAMVPTASCAADERARRQRRLNAIADHVRWHARRLSPGRVLVVTHQAIEEAFAGIPDVVTGHFNAMAGLDSFGDVSAVFIVGRPLPSSAAVPEPCAALFGEVVEGEFTTSLQAVRMRDGSSRTVRVIEHPESLGELVRAAICNDEVVQDVGRGRGVNRTADDPLEVHLLCEVALPLTHDTVTAWEVVAPDVVQRMLLAGVAVDSPSDAALLLPELFLNPEQAKKAFAHAGFKGNSSYKIYRGISLKSAVYRRAGRGRSWQMVYWLDGTETEIRARLEAALGQLAGWHSR